MRLLQNGGRQFHFPFCGSLIAVIFIVYFRSAGGIFVPIYFRSATSIFAPVYFRSVTRMPAPTVDKKVTLVNPAMTILVANC